MLCLCEWLRNCAIGRRGVGVDECKKDIMCCHCVPLSVCVCLCEFVCVFEWCCAFFVFSCVFLFACVVCVDVLVKCVCV